MSEEVLKSKLGFLKHKIKGFFIKDNKETQKEQKLFLVKVLAFSIYVDHKKRDEEINKAIDILSSFDSFTQEELDWYVDEIRLRIEEYKKDIPLFNDDRSLILEYFNSDAEDKREVYEMIELIIKSDYETTTEEENFLTKCKNTITK